jgi:hypothetical protein
MRILLTQLESFTAKRLQKGNFIKQCDEIGVII